MYLKAGTDSVIFIGDFGTAITREVGIHDSVFNAQDLDAAKWNKNANVNIADMVISREFDKDGTGHALMMLKTDSAAPDALINRLRARPGILRVKCLSLPTRSS